MDTRTADPYHFTPEVLTLVINALTRINRAKRDVTVWFRSAGVPTELLTPWEERLRADKDQVHKADIARDVLCKLNEVGDGYLRQRREVVKRLVELEESTSTWPT